MPIAIRPNAHVMTTLVSLFLVASSVALSVGLSRLAVGELFRLARIDARHRQEK
jgi:hypothetical protein